MSEGESPAPDDVNWEAVFDRMGCDPWQPINGPKLSSMTMVETQGVGSPVKANELIGGAVDEGLLESTGNGYVISGAKKPTEDQGAENNIESARDGDFQGNSEGNSERTDGGVSAQSASGSSISRETQTVEIERGKIEAIEARMDAMSKRIDSLDERANTLEDALRSSLGVGPDVSDEKLLRMAEKRSERVDGVEQRAKHNELKIEEMSTTDRDGEMDLQQRVMAIRKELVRKAEQSSAPRMDYNAIDSFMEGLGSGVSRGYANKLVDKAARGHDAFFVKTFDDSRPKQLRVKISRIPEDSIYRGPASS